MIQSILEWSEAELAEPPDRELVPLPIPTRTQYGDVWKLGDHTLYCTDSENREFVHQLVQDHGYAALVFTDPPYQMDNLHGAKTSFVGLGGEDRPMRPVHAAIREMGMGKFEPKRFLDLLPLYFEPGTIAAFVFHSPDNAPDYLSWVQEKRKEHIAVDYTWERDGGCGGSTSFRKGLLHGMSYKQLVWYKGDRPDEEVFEPTANPFPIGKAHRPDSELLSYFRKKGKWNDGDKAPGADRGRVLFHKRVKGEHPTIKPVGLITNQLYITTDPCDVVYDPYGGSGSTLIGCERTGRRCVIVEQLPRFCDLTLSRWEAETGRKAERL